MGATLTTSSGCPDSTADSTANAAASGANGTSNVARSTGRAPDGTSIALETPIVLRPTGITRATASSWVSAVNTCMDARRLSGGITISANAISRMKSRNAKRTSTSTASGTITTARAIAGTNTRSRYRLIPERSASYSSRGICAVFQVLPHWGHVQRSPYATLAS